MNEYGGLIENIACELNIKKEIKEEDSVWMARVVYSVMGKMALASLHDILEDDRSVFIIHFKKRIKNIMLAFLELYPELKEVLRPSYEEFAQEIYSAYLKTGCFYHTPNRLLPAVEMRVHDACVELIRGNPFSDNIFMSGLGTYFKCENVEHHTLEILKMFQIPNCSLSDFWNGIRKKISWSKFENDLKIEYLRIDPPYTRGYWKSFPDTNGEISLLRIGVQGERIYYLYQYENGEMKTSILPKWMTEDSGYRFISNCILAARGTLPALKILRKTEMVYIKQEYLLPPSILNFMKLYSWPYYFSSMPCEFERVMQRDVFEVFENILQVIGIEVNEHCQMEQDQYINN